jgi:NifU-like protein involved in Fe-S cluster formation
MREAGLVLVRASSCDSWIVMSGQKESRNTRTGELITLSYSEAFKDHLAHPRNAGELTDANTVAEETNPACGDRLRLSLLVRDGRIVTARFLAYGCPPTLVCGSALAEILEGMSVEDALKLTRKEIVNAVGGLPPRKQHAAALAIETLRAAIQEVQPLRSEA